MVTDFGYRAVDQVVDADVLGIAVVGDGQLAVGLVGFRPVGIGLVAARAPGEVLVRDMLEFAFVANVPQVAREGAVDADTDGLGLAVPVGQSELGGGSQVYRDVGPLRLSSGVIPIERRRQKRY